MKSLQIKTNPEVHLVFKNYPDSVKEKMLNLRRLILEAAEDVEEIENMEETLKWGEPSYLVKKGSTIRMDWKKNNPDQYAIYFQCTSKLIPTFKAVYDQLFRYEGNRAIIFQLNEPLPEEELRNCIVAGLTYHKIKHLPLLGL